MKVPFKRSSTATQTVLKLNSQHFKKQLKICFTHVIYFNKENPCVEIYAVIYFPFPFHVPTHERWVDHSNWCFYFVAAAMIGRAANMR